MAAPAEALLICSVCRQPIRASAYDDHLRQAHGMFFYAGVHRAAADAVPAILADLISPRPSQDAWDAINEIAQSHAAGRVDEALAEMLGNKLAALPEGNRETVILALAPLVARPRIVAALVGHAETAGRALALACLGRLQRSADTIAALRTLLFDRRLPAAIQVFALAAVWPTLKDDELLADDLVGKLIDGHSKAKVVGLLRGLEKKTGPHPAISDRLDALQQKAKLSCPRCAVQLPHAAMEQHLWDEHRLVLHGLKTRDPWNLLEDWLDEAQGGDAAEVVERCRVAAGKIDPTDGTQRLSRLLLARGLGDANERRDVLAAAREQRASCCPWCFAFIPLPTEAAPAHVNYRLGRLSAQGYEVRTDDRRMRPWLEVHTPAGPVYRGYPPGRSWTIRGFSTLVALPMVLLAVAFACFWPVNWGLPVRAVGAFLGLGVLAWAAVRLYGLFVRPSPLDLLRHAWRFLVPRLHSDGHALPDSAFAAGLARLHGRVGMAGVDAEQVARLLKVTDMAVAKRLAPPAHFAAICRLWIEREVAEGRDPVPLVVGLVGRVFKRQLPFAFAQHLLGDWSTPWWTKTNLARLRVLVCDSAFEENFEVQTLIEAAATAPALGTVVGAGEPRSLAALRLLWSLRASRPWDKLGKVKTVFALAADPEQAAALGEQPDLLLYSRNPSWPVVTQRQPQPTPVTLRLTALGVWLQDVLFRIPPRVFEVNHGDAGSRLVLGEDEFRSEQDLEPLARDMERWFRYAFHEFLPAVDPTLGWKSPDRAAILRAGGAVACPECGRHSLPRLGEVGIRADEP